MMKKINEQKLQAFAIGAMGKRPLSRREQEEQRKREDQEAAAHAFKEFVETFQEAPSSVSKVWVKAGTYDAGSRKEDHSEKGKLYKPSVKLSDEKTSAEKASDYARLLASESKRDALLKKNTHEKKKSNLELFKEELRQIQEEREERHKYKSIARQLPASQSVSASSQASSSSSGAAAAAASSTAVAATVAAVSAGDSDAQQPAAAYRDSDGSLPFDSNGDPNTNLYLGNLSPKISEQQLMEVFGRYGPLASIKIMWPRSEEEKSRGRNCGFVAYMSRKDAERALKACSISYDMKLGWGKAVAIPTLPIYIPPALLEYTMPPPPSGLPFNAQPPAMDTYELPKTHYKEYAADPDKEELFNSVLYKSVVKVVMPTERPLLALIHRMIEFVVREGPMFEAMIMSREIDNPMFRFLFENESPAHIYYRWKLFSLLQGDTPAKWRQKEFRMFKDGSIWKPPPLDFFTQGMPDELIDDDGALETNKGALSNAQRDRLEDLIRHLTLERSKIGDAMIFCIEHAEAADEICECIAESMSNPETMVSKKIARLYLASDILHNCSVKVSNASFFRKAMERNLLDIFKDLNTCYMSMESRLKSEGFKTRVLQVFRAWEDWAVYSREFLSKLKNIFLGLPNIEEKVPQDIDGAPLSGDEKDDEDLDGVPLDGAALLKSAMLRGIPDAQGSPLALNMHKDNHLQRSHANMNDSDCDDDIDGIPLDDDIDGIPLEKFADDKPRGFIPSKWETVDPDQVEAQAITTSKWDTLDPVAPEPPQISADYENSDDSSVEGGLDGRFDEERRTRLREIEVKIMQYQDELEMGKKVLKSGWSMQQQLEHYRRKLIKKTHKELRQQQQQQQQTLTTDSEPETYISKKEKRSSSPADSDRTRRSKRSKRSDSPYSSKRSPHNSSRKMARDSISPTRSVGRSRKRSRSLSDSDSQSPKRREKSPSRSKYELSPPRRSYRSPSPKNKHAGTTTSRSRRSPEKISNRERDLSPSVSKYARHRNDKHKHKHKY